MAVKKDVEVITVRMPRSLIELINKYILVDTHQNRSEFIRDAVREKIRRDFPELFKELLNKESRKGTGS